MFDGKTFLPVTGTPIRKMACMSRPLALADPVPFAVAILNAKSFTIHDMVMDSACKALQRLPAEPPTCGIAGFAPWTSACPTRRSGTARRTGRSARRRSRPSPSRGRSASAGSNEQRLIVIERRRQAVAREAGRLPRRSGMIVRQSVGQMSMHASHSMHSESVKCVCTSQLRQRSTSLRGLLRGEALLDLDRHLLEARRQLDVPHLPAATGS